MKVKIMVEKIRCSRATHPRTDDDEIYMTYCAAVGKQGDDGEPPSKKQVGMRLSKIKRRVNHGTEWVPVSFNTGEKEMPLIVDEPEAEILPVLFMLYEADNEKHYKNLQQEENWCTKPEDLNWHKVISFPDDPTNYMSWITVILKAMVEILKSLLNDDFIASYQNIWLKGYTSHTKNIEFKGNGATYVATIRFEKVD